MEKHHINDFIEEDFNQFILSYRSITLDFKLESDDYYECFEKGDTIGMKHHLENAERDLLYMSMLADEVTNYNVRYGIPFEE